MAGGRLRLRTVRSLAIGVAAVLLAVGLLLPRSRGSSPAPALPHSALRGTAVTVAALRGHAVAVAFFASWCPGCHTEAAALERVAASAGPDRVVGVAYDDRTASAIGFASRYRWTFPLLDDPAGNTGAAYGISHLPTTVILNARGQIVAREVGPQTVTRLRAALRAAG
ncbi:MAG: TlpA disulfide reductase family protein [Solirubrobacteraceae bacterium]|jgi:cytochrome c biogenesis protein CcmG/thiol:disulfide interchange protein DsbE